MMGKVLSIRQPWASLIIQGVKNVENRGWKTRHRGRLYIHAAAAVERNVALPDGVKIDLDSLPRSAIIGSVNVTDCMEDVELPDDPWIHNPWVSGPWCWLLADPQPLRRPFPCVGKLGLWQAPADLLAHLDVVKMERIA